MNVSTKQILVVRRDLNMRKGKIAAQCCHASMAFLTRDGFIGQVYNDHVFINIELGFGHLEEIDHWLKNSFSKICVYVNSEEELLTVHQKALDANLISHLVEDNGATEFNGVKTLTCCAIGPHFDSKFEGITNHLPLL